MEEGQGQTNDSDTDDSDTEIGGCSPAECRTDSDGDTPTEAEHMEPAGNVDEESAEEFSNDTDEEEGGGITDMSQLGSGPVAVKLQTVHQESYQLVGEDTKSLAQHVIGCCQEPEREIASSPQQLEQFQPSGDEQEAGRGPVSKIIQVLETSPVTPTSTSSLLPRRTIPGSLVSQIQSSRLPGVPFTGASSALTQYNLIQVQQQFGDVTVKGAKNLNIGGTQNVGGAPANQEEEEKPLTAAQRIRKRTTSRIQSWTKGMVETDALKKVKEKLNRGATWVTITGRPGEGKSTTAYMALEDQYSQGRQVYQVVSPHEFNEVIMACSNPVILLDDIFGDLEFDAGELAKWTPSFRPIVDVKDPDKYAEKDAVDKSPKTEKVSEKTKIDQKQQKRTSPNENKTIIILVGRHYVLKSSLPSLGRMADYISSPQYAVEVSSQRDSHDRREIWRVHAEAKNINFEESIVSEIYKADCPHGFPHVCKMFVAVYEKDWTHLQIQTFFKAPLHFLRETLDKFLKNTRKRLLFMAMIKKDGKISGQELEEDDNLGYECIAVADDLVGSYLKKEDDSYMFDHPSIYDSVAFILSTTQSRFVIETCSLSFINQRLRIVPTVEREKGVAGEKDLIANIPWTYAKLLARRFASEMHRSNLLHVLSHQACSNSDFVDLLIDCLKTQFHMCASDILNLTDKSSNQSFREILPSSKSHHLFKSLTEKENLYI